MRCLGMVSDLIIRSYFQLILPAVQVGRSSALAHGMGCLQFVHRMAAKVGYTIFVMTACFSSPLREKAGRNRWRRSSV